MEKGCHWCGKIKLAYMLVPIPEFGEIKLCLHCWNSTRPLHKRAKFECWSQVTKFTIPNNSPPQSTIILRTKYYFKEYEGWVKEED